MLQITDKPMLPSVFYGRYADDFTVPLCVVALLLLLHIHFTCHHKRNNSHYCWVGRLLHTSLWFVTATGKTQLCQHTETNEPQRVSYALHSINERPHRPQQQQPDRPVATLKTTTNTQ